MKLSYTQFQECVKELKALFMSNQHRGSVDVREFEGTNRALVKVKTNKMVFVTYKENMYFHGAILKSDNYSIEVVDGVLSIAFGFSWE